MLQIVTVMDLIISRDIRQKKYVGGGLKAVGVLTVIPLTCLS